MRAVPSSTRAMARSCALSFALLSLATGCGSSMPGAGDPVDASPSTDAAADAAPDSPPPPQNLHSLRFDGVDDFVTIPLPVDPSTFSGVTIEAWVKPEAGGSTAAIIGKSRSGPSQQLGLARLSNNQLEGAVNDATSGCVAFGASTTFTQGGWHHVALTYRKTIGQPTIYLDGQLVAQSTCSTAMAPSLNDLLIGAHLVNGARVGHFTGLIDEVRLWSVARTQAEIQQARSVLLAPSTAGLVGYWQFEETDGEIVHDSTSNQ